MTNSSLKTALGWLIIVTQLLLLSQVFRYSLMGKFQAPERDAALAPLVPQLSSYFSAVVVFMLKSPRSRQTKWAREKASINAVVIALLLPLLAASGSFVVVERAALGQMDTDDFMRYLTYLQAAQAFVSTTIYAYFFRTEMAASQRAAS